MPTFLSLPAEIRFQIYRELRSFKSPLIKSPFQNESSDSNAFGYCSFGFCSRILETNHQISSEAKEVFYGENYWTFFASQNNCFSSILFEVEPLILILPFIRKAHIRLAMLRWLYWESRGLGLKQLGDIIKANLKSICQVLLAAPNLRTVKIIWTETCAILPPLREKGARSVRSLIFEVLRPLSGLPRTSKLQKSNIMAAYWNGVKASEMEREFSDCVDEVITIHRSLKVS